MGKCLLFRILSSFLFVLAAPLLLAATYSHSGEEVDYTFEARFRSLQPADSRLDGRLTLSLAEDHAAHLFGLFHTAEYAEAAGYRRELVEGFAGTKKVKILSHRSYRVEADPYVWIQYKASGQMLVLNRVLEGWTGQYQSARVPLPLLLDLPAIYADQEHKTYRSKKWQKCTDSYYSSPSDFSYFYNPYRCPELAREPIAEMATFEVKRKEALPFSFDAIASERVPLREIHSDNGNGNLSIFYFANGYDEVPSHGTAPGRIRRDAGWKSYQALENLLLERFAFEKIEGLPDLRDRLGVDFDNLKLLSPVSLRSDVQRRYFSTFIKRVGRKTIVVRSGLFDTRNEGANRSFPSFWKEAWENGDFIYFGGHSGDGQALNLRNLLSTLGAAELNDLRLPFSKTQIAFIDSCSSYDHYQQLYKSLNPHGLHLMTYGLVSLFHLAPATLEATLNLLLQVPAKAPSWTEALRNIETAQLQAHVEHLYEKKDWNYMFDYFEKQGAYPSFLLNVSTPDP